MQERTLAAFLTELRAMPRWDDTVVMFVSDHGEQFREHGALYHIHTLYEEEIRIPGWILSGSHGLTDAQKNGLRTYAMRRTYSQDLNATVLDLFGAFDDRASFPYASELRGRSLLRPAPPQEPLVAMTTATGVWEPDVFVYGVMRGDRLLMGTPAQTWFCWDIPTDPKEVAPHAASFCGDMKAEATKAFPGVVPDK
jgi:arylsulfatase A-like enzyme